MSLNLQALRNKAETVTEEEIEAFVGRIISVVADAAEDDSRPKAATKHLLAQMADAVEQTVTGSYTSAGLDSLLTRQPLALGAGTDPTGTADNEQLERLSAIATSLGLDLEHLLEITEQLFTPLTDAAMASAQRIARTSLMTGVAEGDFKVEDDGTPAIVAAKAAVDKELDSTKKERDTLKTFKDQFPGLDTAADKDARVKGMQLIAKGTTVVDPNGFVAPGATHPMAQENIKLQTVIDSIKTHSREERLPTRHNLVVDISKLPDAAKAALKK